MNEPCVCGGSGVNGGGPCHWCSAGTIPRALLRVVMDPNVGYLTSETQNLISEAYSVIRADHKDTTEPEPCPHCKGEHWFGNYDHPDHCPVCGGSGLVNSP